MCHSLGSVRVRTCTGRRRGRPCAIRPRRGLSPAYGNRLAYNNGLGFSYHRHGLRVAGFAGGYYSRSVFVAPIGPVWPALPPISTLTPFGWVPGFLDAGWGVGPGWGLYAPPVVVVPPPIVLAGGIGDNDRRGDGNPALAFEQLPRPIEPLPAARNRESFSSSVRRRSFLSRDK